MQIAMEWPCKIYFACATKCGRYTIQIGSRGTACWNGHGMPSSGLFGVLFFRAMRSWYRVHYEYSMERRGHVEMWSIYHSNPWSWHVVLQSTPNAIKWSVWSALFSCFELLASNSLRPYNGLSWKCRKWVNISQKTVVVVAYSDFCYSSPSFYTRNDRLFNVSIDFMCF